MPFPAGAQLVLLLMLLPAVVTGTGCASRRNTELLEAQLRDREDELHQTQAELASVRTDLVATRREITQIQTQLANGTSSAPAPETTRAIAQATGIRINAMQTGGLNQDEQPGDDVLHTVIEPLDGHGQVIAVPGELTVEVIDPSLPPEKRQVSVATWQAKEAAELWRSGLLTTGYQVQLPWKQKPGSRTVVLHVRLKTPDGRQFDSTETVPITPPGDTYADQPLPAEQPLSGAAAATEAQPGVSRILSRNSDDPTGPPVSQPLRPAGYQQPAAEDSPFRQIEEPARRPATGSGSGSSSETVGPAAARARAEIEELFQLPRSP